MGTPRSEETKRKISEARKGKGLHTPETRARLSAAATEREARKRAEGGWSEESRAKASEASKRKVNTKHSDETKKKLSEAGKGRVVSEETRQKLRDAHARRTPEQRSAQAKKGADAAAKVLKGRKVSPEEIARRTATRRKNNGGSYMKGSRFITKPMEDLPAGGNGYEHKTDFRHLPDSIERMRKGKRKNWEDGVYANRKKPVGRPPSKGRRVSKTELALVPFLEALGYEHVNYANHFYIHTPGKGMVPDFVDRKGKRVFEYFGNFWHHPNDEEYRTSQYKLAGWDCTVLWELDLAEWVGKNSHLVTEEQRDNVLALTRMAGILKTRGNPEQPDPLEE